MFKHILMLVIVIFVISTTGCSSSSTSTIPNSVDLTTPILSLDREITAHGQFILGTGFIKSDPSYYYYETTPTGGYKLNWISARTSTIFEDENVSPYIKTHYVLSTRGFNGVDNEFGKNGDEYISRYHTLDQNYIGMVYHLYHRDGDIEIHIPLNSIRREFIP